MTAIAPRSRSVIGAAVAPLRSSTALAIGLGLIALHLVLAVLAPVIGVHDPVATDSTNVLAGPEWTHWLGTDQYGRDILSRT
ncbi:MAG: ABC transporter permease, partial [Curtobacterium sp.]